MCLVQGRPYEVRDPIVLCKTCSCCVSLYSREYITPICLKPALILSGFFYLTDKNNAKVSVYYVSSKNIFIIFVKIYEENRNVVYSK